MDGKGLNIATHDKGTFQGQICRQRLNFKKNKKLREMCCKEKELKAGI